MAYTMTLIVEGREVSIPVLPDKLEISSPGKNEKPVVLQKGEVLVLRKKALRSVSWNSFFPAYNAPYVTGKYNDPSRTMKALQRVRDRRKPIRLLITGTDLDVNMRVGIDFLNYEERGGEVGDIYYSIKLTEWKDYSASRIVLPKQPNQPATQQQPKRTGSPPEKKTHSVVKNDCLWAIAQKAYGDGSRWKEIYAANKGTIDAQNKGTGNPSTTIYPGQVFHIP